jgi:hypothetical protein
MDNLEKRMDSIETRMDSLEDKVDSIDRKLDKLIFAITGDDITEGMGKRLQKVEKTLQEDLIPWKHFVQKAVVIMGTFVSVLAIARYFS